MFSGSVGTIKEGLAGKGSGSRLVVIQPITNNFVCVVYSFLLLLDEIEEKVEVGGRYLWEDGTSLI